MFGGFAGVHPLRIACALALVSFVAAVAATLSPREVQAQDSEALAQPIAFSHAHHVSEVGLDCQLCHVYARRGPVAGIPSVETCAGCHRQVLSENPEVLKVLEYWEDEQPIPWIRVHDLQDYVRFSHKRHVLAGVDCAECHGQVGQMEIAVQVESLSMGWCVTCHEERQAPLDCLTCHY